MFSIASDIGRRSSSDRVCRELLRISLITVGLKSFDNLGVLVVGVGGAVATTMITGTLAARKGLAKACLLYTSRCV